ncbi:MAG: Holliday junction branch migration protein RuvA [Patescibacteria group bacterium]
MIISLQGKVIHKEPNFLILENAGIGYQIYFSDPQKIQAEDNVRLFIYEHIREDRHDLFGFLSFDELEFFIKLLSVDGVGPKMAMNISRLGIEKIQKAVLEGNVSFIESVHGVGKKTAQKIILELKGAIDKVITGKNINQEALSALLGLGYSRAEAESVLNELGEVSGTEAQVKAALKLLGKK